MVVKKKVGLVTGIPVDQAYQEIVGVFVENSSFRSEVCSVGARGGR